MKTKTASPNPTPVASTGSSAVPAAAPAPATPQRALKPAAKKPAATKATATKTAEPKSRAPRKSARKPIVKAGFTHEDVALRAYFVAEKRRVGGLPGDEHSDWVEAEHQLRAERGPAE